MKIITEKTTNWGGTKQARRTKDEGRRRSLTGREGPKIENARPLLCQMCLWCASVCVFVCVVGALVCVVSDVSASEARLVEGRGWWLGGAAKQTKAAASEKSSQAKQIAK